MLLRSSFLPFILAAVVVSQNVRAAVTKLATEDRAVIEHPVRVQMLLSTHAIPVRVRAACAKIMSEHRFRVADPGRPFNVTDAGWDDRIPGRRLIWAAQVNKYFIVHYESGGIAHSFHLLVVRDNGSNANVIWAAAADELFKDYAAFAEALHGNRKLRDELPYYH